jgi:hypothetical protein
VNLHAFQQKSCPAKKLGLRSPERPLQKRQPLTIQNKQEIKKLTQDQNDPSTLIAVVESFKK